MNFATQGTSRWISSKAARSIGIPITRASAQMWSWAFVEPPVAATWRRPFLRLASVTMSEKRTPSFVSVTMRSPTSRACLYLADEQKSMVVLSMGQRPITSANTPMVLAVPYIEQVPQEKQMFSRNRVKVSSLMASMLR